MAWVTRGRRRYYYQSRYRGGQREKVYLGSGAQAQEASAAVEARRHQRRDQAKALRQEEKSHDDAVTPLEELCRLTDLLMQATLIDLGYHLHARGEWRKRRAFKRDRNAPEGVSLGAEGDPGASQRR